MSTNKTHDPRLQAFIDSIRSDEAFAAAIRNTATNAMAETGDVSFAFFTSAMVEYMREDLKDVFRGVRAAASTAKSESKSAVKTTRPKVEGNWRAEIDARFDGRGNVWAFAPLYLVQGHIAAMREVGIDCDAYDAATKAHGKAWMRYMGTRLCPESNQPCALFWIWPAGSKGVVGKMDESAWVYVPQDLALNDKVIELIGTTPYKAGLENEKPKNFGLKKEVVVEASADVDAPAESLEVVASDDDLDALDDELFGA